MTLEKKIAAMIEHLPQGVESVTFSTDWLRAELDICDDSLADLTAEQVAEQLGRSPSTIRGWCIDGRLRAYKLNGREWRVPRAAIREYLEGQKNGDGRQATRPNGKPDLSAWKKVWGLGE